MANVAIAEIISPDIVVVQTTSQEEAELGTNIASLWSAHQDCKSVVRHTKKQHQQVRIRLAEKLYQMKSLLARTGRSGGWCAFLRSSGVPRASADRYVQQHLNLITSPKENCLTEAIKSPESRARHLAQKLLPKLRSELLTPGEVFYFMNELAMTLPAAASRYTAEGIEVLKAAERPSPEPIDLQLAMASDLSIVKDEDQIAMA